MALRCSGQEFPFFYVLFTVHLGIILVNDQLDAQFFFLVCINTIDSPDDEHEVARNM
jgi:hypothetical protein